MPQKDPRIFGGLFLFSLKLKKLNKYLKISRQELTILTKSPMRKINCKILTLCVAIILLAGCSNKYRVEKPELTEEQKTQYHEEIDEAISSLEDGSMDDATKIQHLGKIAVRYHWLGQYDSAVKYYEKIIKLDPTDFLALNNIIDLYDEIGEFQLARQYIESLYDNYKDQRNVVEDVINNLVKNKEFDNAQLVLEEFAREYSEDTEGDLVFISSEFEYIRRMKGEN